MTTFIIISVVAVFLIAIVGIVRGRGNEPRRYQYKQKSFFMSRAEHECYDALILAVGDKFHIFPQVHLPSIVDNKVVGQNWLGAFRHISQKSVDFVLCDKAYISPKLAIELDDRTHERQDRRDRDSEVERVLKGAGLPLLRLENHGRFNPNELLKKINVVLGDNNSTKQGGVKVQMTQEEKEKMQKLVIAALREAKDEMTFEKDPDGRTLPTLRNKDLFQSYFQKFKDEGHQPVNAFDKVNEVLGKAEVAHYIEATMFDPRKSTIVFPTAELAQRAQKRVALTEELDKKYLAEK